MIDDEKDEIIEELLESLLSRYQIGLKESLKGGYFFYYIDLLRNKYHKINPNRGGSYV